MNWRNTAIEELRSYGKICVAEKSLRERLEALEARVQGLEKVHDEEEGGGRMSEEEMGKQL
jgi:hypothetical protein